MRATSRMSRCTHWMHVDWRHPSLAGAPGEICLRAKHTRFRIGSHIAGLPRGHGFCWRRSRRVPCLIRNGRVAEAARVVAVALVAAEVAVVEEAGAAEPAEPAAAPEAVLAAERVEAAQAAVALAERAVAAAVGPAVGPAAEQEEALVVEPEEAEEAPAAGD